MNTQDPIVLRPAMPRQPVPKLRGVGSSMRDLAPPGEALAPHLRERESDFAAAARSAAEVDAQPAASKPPQPIAGKPA